MIKIKDWKKLNGVTLNKGYYIDVTSRDSVFIIQHTNFSGIYLPYEKFNNSEIIAMLKLFGLEVEFIEPRIYTTEEKALATAFKSGWVASDADNRKFHYSAKPIKENYRFDNAPNSLNEIICRIPAHLFPWLTFDDEPLDLSEVK